MTIAELQQRGTMSTPSKEPSRRKVTLDTLPTEVIECIIGKGCPFRTPSFFQLSTPCLSLS